eukprot:m.51931 g.51931  ORF g.51931 m.51931 type:complete len:751 (+) comp6337_c0_seq2:25-2277(+)
MAAADAKPVAQYSAEQLLLYKPPAYSFPFAVPRRVYSYADFKKYRPPLSVLPTVPPGLQHIIRAENQVDIDKLLAPLRAPPSERGGSGGRADAPGKWQRGAVPRDQGTPRRDTRARGQPARGGAKTIVMSLGNKPVQLHKTENAYVPKHKSSSKDAEGRIAIVRSALNKLTEDKFPKLSKEILAASKGDDLNDLVIPLVVDKAASERAFAGLYARLCKVLCDLPSFRKQLLNYCQARYETLLARPSKEITLAEKALTVGFVRFLGELFCVSVAPFAIAGMCFSMLLDLCRGGGGAEEQPLECLCALLVLTGPLQGTHPAFEQTMDALAELLPGLPSRLRFMVMDVQDLRASGWNPKAPKGKAPARPQPAKPAASPAPAPAKSTKAATPGVTSGATLGPPSAARPGSTGATPAKGDASRNATPSKPTTPAKQKLDPEVLERRLRATMDELFDAGDVREVEETVRDLVDGDYGPVLARIIVEAVVDASPAKLPARLRHLPAVLARTAAGGCMGAALAATLPGLADLMIDVPYAATNVAELLALSARVAPESAAMLSAADAKDLGPHAHAALAVKAMRTLGGGPGARVAAREYLAAIKTWGWAGDADTAVAEGVAVALLASRPEFPSLADADGRFADVCISISEDLKVDAIEHIFSSLECLPPDYLTDTAFLRDVSRTLLDNIATRAASTGVWNGEAAAGETAGLAALWTWLSGPEAAAAAILATAGEYAKGSAHAAGLAAVVAAITAAVQDD